jgi:gamma-glutamyltranspeptidase / glutathione hydrolase
MKTRWLCLLMIGSSLPLAADDGPIESRRDASIQCRRGAVVSISGPASDVGVAILKKGGNAVDSAIATAFALAVTHPAAGNIGGGGYMLVVPPAGESLVIDFREVAPAAATRETFVDPTGRTAHRRVGVPGTVRGLAMAHFKWGRLPWRDLVQGAVDLAKHGFLLETSTADSLNELLATSDKSRFSELHRVFGKQDEMPWRAGDRLTQTDLAHTLQLIAERGADGFYLGEVADKIVAEMKRGDGLITAKDLAEYRPIARAPLRGTYRGYEVISAPPSSSGGTTLMEALNILECFELDAKRDAPSNVHRIVEAMRRAYRDRARYLGDPEVTPPPAFLLRKDHARSLATSITDNATPSRDLAGDIELTVESEQTTHFSVVDEQRMAVSLTYTLENSYGSRVVVPGAGFLLNDEMNDFNWLPGITNQAGRIGTEPNLVRPGRRMLSSMCPTMLARDGKVVLVTGSPGGRTIINTVLCIITNVVDFKMDARAAVDAPRLHHGWFPDAIRMEPGWSPTLAEELKRRGHTLSPFAQQGDAHSIWIDHAKGELVGVADRRIQGKAAGY